MDRIIKITVSLFVVILVAFVAVIGYTGYIENAYRSSLTSTYSYSCTITTDSPLTNVTFFLPVPADRTGNSPVIAQISARDITGIPDTWNTELYESGKSTLVKITIPSLVPPEGTTPKNPFSITFSTNITSKEIIDTRDPVTNSAMFRPVKDVRETECEDSNVIASGGKCSAYLTSLYARYDADPNAAVSIRSSVAGKNQWKIFEPRENEYRTSIYVLMFGPQDGWTLVKGDLEDGMGAYDAPQVHSG
ncbi:hypothetical protein [Methanoregula sp.]|uniref:hypothetical protein n=1 Tax=Methanoregula sp. TaxID=2052170 RepID=UPI0023703BB0|nr:hypothetical protein [Methanoregula sp.]MDD1687210.1 hypothetical protein [Methanoregula sp.]